MEQSLRRLPQRRAIDGDESVFLLFLERAGQRGRIRKGQSQNVRLD